MMRLVRLLLLILLYTLLLNRVVAEESGLQSFRLMLENSGFPENGETRRIFSEAINAPSYSAVSSSFAVIRQLSDGNLVQFELRKGLREWYLIFRNQRTDGPGESYPIWGRGNWIIKKDLLKDDFIQAKIFLQDDENSFVRIFPLDAGRSRIDIHIFGRQIGDDVIIPVAFEELMQSSFSKIAYLSRSRINWSGIFPNPRQEGYRRVEAMVRQVRQYQKSIVEFEDAAIDGYGLNVFIETGENIPADALNYAQSALNCSGYVKWIMDGIHSFWVGTPGARYLDISSLRQATSRANSNPWNLAYSAFDKNIRLELESLLRDPYFGLDWNRNLAYHAESARLNKELSADQKLALEAGNLSGLSYTPDMGYPLEHLSYALYELASRRPGAIYLAAINSRFVPDTSDENFQTLPLHQYWHVSILAPWFSDGEGWGNRGAFHIAVLDSGDVSSISSIRNGSAINAYSRFILQKAKVYGKAGKDAHGKVQKPQVMVNLIKVDLPADFLLPPLP